MTTARPAIPVGRETAAVLVGGASVGEDEGVTEPESVGVSPGVLVAVSKVLPAGVVAEAEPVVSVVAVGTTTVTEEPEEPGGTGAGVAGVAGVAPVSTPDDEGLVS